MILFSFAAVAQDAARAPHALEVLALKDPDAALAAFPAAEARARRDGDALALAKLGVAKANACRMFARWVCQEGASNEALEAASTLKDPYWRIRALIARSRAQANQSNFNAASAGLAQAEALLTRDIPATLVADIKLAYSSITYELGQLTLSERYAREGLAFVHAIPVSMQVRLLRNQARALSDLGRQQPANEAIAKAQRLLPQINDLKLRAEVWFGAGRVAVARGDASEVSSLAERLVEAGQQLKNTQVLGMGYEMQARAACMRGDSVQCRASYHRALAEFERLDLYRDETRVVRELLRDAVVSRQTDAALGLVEKYNDLTDRIRKQDRDKAADDFRERTEAAEQREQLVQSRLLARVRAAEVEASRKVTWLVFALLAVALLAAAALAWLYRLQLRTSRRLKRVDQQRLDALMLTSHDIRNPISGIMGLCEDLLNDARHSGIQNELRAIHSASAGLLDLSQGLLDHGRLETSRLTLRPEPTGLREMLEDLVAVYAAQAQKKGLQLRLSAPGNLPAAVLIDGSRFKQVVGNLLGNAVKFTNVGEIDLIVSEQSREPDRILLRFDVRDSGPGFAADEAEGLFDPFFKGAEGARNVLGSGLGLSIAHDLVGLMGDKLTATSTPGQGATFSFQLDLPIVDLPLAMGSEAIDQAPMPPARGKILLVEDDDISAQLMALKLETLGWTCERVATPNEALVATAGQTHHAILLDYELGAMTGGELAGRIRTQRVREGLPVPPIIVISAHERKHPGMAVAVDAWLGKPITVNALAEALQRTSPPRGATAAQEPDGVQALP